MTEGITLEQVEKAHCKKCGHLWIPIKRRIPRLCPKCKSYNWQEPLMAGRGRPRKKRGKLDSNESNITKKGRRGTRTKPSGPREFF